MATGSCPWNSPPLACALLLSRRWDGFTEGSAVVPAKRPRPVRPRCHSTTQSTGVSLVVQGLRLHTFTAGSTGLTPGQGTKILQAERHCQKQKQDTIHGCKLEVEAVVFSYRLHLIIHLRNFCFPKMDSGFNPWVRKTPWSRKWQPNPVVLPGKFHGQRSLAGYSPWGRKELDTIECART